RVADEAPVAPRGGDEDEEMPQDMPPPPSTQGERISRLEEEGQCTLHEIFRVTGRVSEMHQAVNGWCQHFRSSAAARPVPIFLTSLKEKKSTMLVENLRSGNFEVLES
ncbi:hypothetical protein Tco_0882277, partial [Tanacetum coccineum]